ncbi:MAG: SCO family protein [Akkermansiaceae bacterium]|nr:SCO family protein [Verrucomicrobiales bacterium]
MNPPARTFPWTIAIGLLLVFLTLALLFLMAQLKSRTAARPSSPALPEIAQVKDFTLTNQAGAAVTLADLRGRVWVADIIFTRCPGPCARMTRQMKELQAALPPNSGVKLVSLTTDPEFDTPEVLSRYAERFEANTNQWMFLTGSKNQIAEVASGSLKLAAVEKKPEERESTDDLFIHSTIFVVVDKGGKLRGVFETGGENVDWAKSRQDILNAVKTLESER